MKTLAPTSHPFRFSDLPKDYTGLCQHLLPRPIHSRAAHREVVAMADAMAGHRLSKDQADYFDLLCSLIEDYDQPDEPKASGLEALKHLMEAHDMSGSKLAELLGVTRSLASRLLSGERELTRSHIATLASHFGVGHAAFF